MDHLRFDTLIKHLAIPGSRRRLLGGLLGGALGLVGRGTEARTCTAPGTVCREHANCCSELCGPKDRTGRRRCQCQSPADCPPASDQCHSATCVAGVCGETVLIGQVCNDGNACITGETCQADGSCGGGAVDDGIGCSGGLCFGGVCVVGATCSDDDDCDTDFVCATDTHTCKDTNPSPQCAGFSYCGTYGACGDGAGACFATIEGGGFCAPNNVAILFSVPCTSSADCGGIDLCMDVGCGAVPPAPGYYCASGTLLP